MGTPIRISDDEDNDNDDNKDNNMDEDGSKEEATTHGMEGRTRQENEANADERLRREPNARLLG